MPDDSPLPDDEPDDSPWLEFESADFAEAVQLRLVPKDDPNPALLRELAAVFEAAAFEAGCIPPQDLVEPVPDDQGVQLRAILDQKAEEIREKADAAEPRAAELKKRIKEKGDDANAAEVEAARERLFQTILELRRIGVVITAQAE